MDDEKRKQVTCLLFKFVCGEGTLDNWEGGLTMDSIGIGHSYSGSRGTI